MARTQLAKFLDLLTQPGVNDRAAMPFKSWPLHGEEGDLKDGTSILLESDPEESSTHDVEIVFDAEGDLVGISPVRR